MKVLLLFLVCVAVVVGGQDVPKKEYDLEFEMKDGKVKLHVTQLEDDYPSSGVFEVFLVYIFEYQFENPFTDLL